jgi:hypothetical protein
MKRAVLTTAQDVQRQAVTWVWRDRLSSSSLGILAGAPGVGKSMLTTLLAAGLSRGTLPGAYHGQPARSIFMSLEDDRAAVLKPRLEAVQADLSLISFLDVADDESEDVLTFVLPDHLDMLTEAVWRTRPVLVVIDPIGAALDGSVDSHRDASVRRVLAPLARLAQDAACHVKIVHHTNKAVGGDALRRLGGSIAFSGAPRNGLLLAHDPSDPEGVRGCRRHLAHFKSNSGRLAPTLEYEVQSVLLPASLGAPKTQTAKLHLLGESALDSEDLLTTGDQDERSDTDEAVDLLKAELANGPRSAEDMQKAANRAGIGKKALRRAKERLGVKSKREGFGPGSVVKWALDATQEGIYETTRMTDRETASESAIPAIHAHPQNGGIYADGRAPMTEAEEDRLGEIGRQLGLLDGGS